MMEARYALVTGAAGGIGREVARRFRRQGYTVLAVERNDELSKNAAWEIGDGTVAIACDLSDAESVSALEGRIEGEWSDRLEVCFLNAGVIVPGEVKDSTVAELELQMAVMLTSTLRLARSATRVFTPKNRGHLIATVSEGAILALPGSAAYSAAKAGLRAFLAALSYELRGTDVVISGIYPSAVDTPMLRHEATHGGSLLNFIGKISTVDDVADAVEKALSKSRLEIYVPYGDSILSRVLQCVPWLVPTLLPIGEKLGEKGRRKFLASIEQ